MFIIFPSGNFFNVSKTLKKKKCNCTSPYMKVNSRCRYINRKGKITKHLQQRQHFHDLGLVKITKEATENTNH